MSKLENIGITTHSKSKVFFRNVTFYVYKGGFDYNPEKMRKFYTVEQCTQERQNIKWRIKLIAIVTVFAALLNNTSQLDVRNLSYLNLYYDILENWLLSDKDEQP